MPFLTRWDDDHSRPTVLSALRDVAVRAILPAIALFAQIVGFGFLLKGPLTSYSTWENGISTWFQDGRTDTWNAITKFMSMIGNTEYVIAVGVIVCAVIWWRTSAASGPRSTGSTRPRPPRATPAATSAPPRRSTCPSP